MIQYFVAQIRINNSEEYLKYLDKFDEIFEKYNGEVLAVDDTPVVLEGSWPYTRSVIIKFNSKEEFKDWYYSNDYQKILKHRLNGSKCDTLLISGYE